MTTQNGGALHARRAIVMYRIWIVGVVTVTVLDLSAHHFQGGSNALTQALEFIGRDILTGALAACLPGGIYWALTGKKPKLSMVTV